MTIEEIFLNATFMILSHDAENPDIEIIFVITQDIDERSRREIETWFLRPHELGCYVKKRFMFFYPPDSYGGECDEWAEHIEWDKVLELYDENIKEMNDQLLLMKNDMDTAKKEMEKLEVSLEAASKEIENRMKDSESLSEAEANMLIGRLNDMRNRWENYRGNIAGRQQRYDNLLGVLRETQLEKIEFQRTKEQRYDALMGELRQAQMEKTRLERINSVKMYNTEILVAAEEPKAPVKPNKLLNILVAAVVGLIVGLGLAFSLEYFEKTE